MSMTMTTDHDNFDHLISQNVKITHVPLIIQLNEHCCNEIQCNYHVSGNLHRSRIFCILNLK